MYQIIDNIPVFGQTDPETVKQMQEAMKYEAVCGALMADHHIGYSVPIGGVLGYNESINVNGVGFDIACGCKAVRVTKDPQALRQDIYRTMNEIYRHISFGVGRKNQEEVDHQLFDYDVWNEIPLLKDLKDKAREQLGTVGSGNHYVDLFIDDDDRVWIGVHFGSRGLGHTIATHFIKAAGGSDGIHAKPVILHEKSDLGEQYIKCMQLAGEYAYAGRDWVCAKVAEILNTHIVEEVHNHHNFAWQEVHNEKSLWIVRKGATPNFPGTRSFVGGSMGDFSYILEGIASDESILSLSSTIHGAGRTMGRNEARGKIDRKTGKILSAGKISEQDMQNWIKKFDVELRGAGVDEAPQAYKRIEQVLFAHSATTRIISRLKPIGVAMASPETRDPYKD